MDDKIEALLKEYNIYAQENGFELNQKKEVVVGLMRKLLDNEEKYGKKFCPCRVITGNHEEDDKKICPCIFMNSEIEEKGHCHCGLFLKPVK